jgi:hypothetical protein
MTNTSCRTFVQVEPAVRLRVQRAQARERHGHPPPLRLRAHGGEPPLRPVVRGRGVLVPHLHPDPIGAIPANREHEPLRAGQVARLAAHQRAPDVGTAGTRRAEAEVDAGRARAVRAGLGAITSATIEDDGSNSGWNVVGALKESRTRVAGGTAVAPARRPRRGVLWPSPPERPRSGSTRPKARPIPAPAPPRDTPGPGTSASIARSAVGDRAAVAQKGQSASAPGDGRPRAGGGPARAAPGPPSTTGTRAGSMPPAVVNEKPSAGASASSPTKLRPRPARGRSRGCPPRRRR